MTYIFQNTGWNNNDERNGHFTIYSSMFHKVKRKQTVEHIRLENILILNFKNPWYFFCSLTLMYLNYYKYNMYICFNSSKIYMKIFTFNVLAYMLIIS